jgi:hypothetical protein
MRRRQRNLLVACWSKDGVLTDDVVQKKASAMLDNSSAEPGSVDLDQWSVEIRHDSWQRFGFDRR